MPPTEFLLVLGGVILAAGLTVALLATTGALGAAVLPALAALALLVRLRR